jgi:plasmid stabilization system protein ParE
LPKNEKERIFEAIKKLAEFPYIGTKLRGKLEGL